MLSENKEYQEIYNKYKDINPGLVDNWEAAIKFKALMRLLKCPYDLEFYARQERKVIERKMIDRLGYNVTSIPQDRKVELTYR